MRLMRQTAVKALMLFMLCFAGMLAAQIAEAPEAVLDASGIGVAELRLETASGDLAGLQGRVLFDPSLLESLTLTMPPQQPASFRLYSHTIAPGEIRFVLYSASDVLAPNVPFLHGLVEAKSDGATDGLDSVLVCELESAGTPDFRMHRDTDRYLNVPVRMEASSAGDAFWLHVY